VRRIRRVLDEVRRTRLAVRALFKKVLISGLPGTISDL
jgi:hypothetical protein